MGAVPEGNKGPCNLGIHKNKAYMGSTNWYFLNNLEEIIFPTYSWANILGEVITCSASVFIYLI